MKKQTLRRLLCLVLAVLLAAAVLTMTGCSIKKAEKVPEKETVSADSRKELGEGEKAIYFDVTFSDGSTSSYAIHTDADTVGQALLDEKLIAGEDSDYGLYVKTVDGETLDWDTDGSYWAFYVDGEFASAGVDSTEIKDGATYAFVATKGE